MGTRGGGSPHLSLWAGAIGAMCLVAYLTASTLSGADPLPEGAPAGTTSSDATGGAGEPSAPGGTPPPAPTEAQRGVCPIRGSWGRSLSEGTVEDSEHVLDAAGEVRLVVIPVTFAGRAPGPSASITSVLAEASERLRTASRGRLRVRPTVVERVAVAPPFGSAWATVTSMLLQADGDVNFRGFDVAVLVGPAWYGSPAFAFPLRPGLGVQLDRSDIRRIVYLSEGAAFAGSGPSWLVHELGHVFGLPDLYDTDIRVHGVKAWARLNRWVGAWDPMGSADGDVAFFAWHQQKLGWTGPGQFLCLRAGSRTVDLVGVGVPGGLKGVEVPVGESAAVVVEARRRQGLDADVCAEGVLVYRVDGEGETGDGPVQVVPARRGADQGWDQCAPLRDAAFTPGPDGMVELRAGDATVSVAVLARTADGFRVRVSVTPRD